MAHHHDLLTDLNSIRNSKSAREIHEKMFQLTPACPLDVIAFILLLNFDGLLSRI